PGGRVPGGARGRSATAPSSGRASAEPSRAHALVPAIDPLGVARRAVQDLTQLVHLRAGQSSAFLDLADQLRGLANRTPHHFLERRDRKPATGATETTREVCGADANDHGVGS